ncbi:MAG: hypothetical protein JJV97_06025 [SAR324 cluster bacterium]|nr:hypothetical protein [SAR324 cluster bacterium]
MDKNKAKLTYPKLIKQVRLWDDIYYGDNPENKGATSDHKYDRSLKTIIQIEEQFPKLKIKDSPTTRVGKSNLDSDSGDFITKKISHRIAMLSLENIFSKPELQKWIKTINKNLSPSNIIQGDKAPQIVAELKIDGVAISLRYNKGVLVEALTRGDGTKGRSIYHNIVTIKNIPKKIPKTSPVEIRGELYFPKANFTKYNEQLAKKKLPLFKTPRNVAAGSAGMKSSIDFAKRGLKIIAYDIVEGYKGVSHFTNMEQLKKWGFSISSHRIKTNNINRLLAFCDEWEEKRDTLSFMIDGVVLKIDNLTQRELLGKDNKSPKWARAWKFNAKRAGTKLLNIENSVSRYGLIIPVAVFEPVILDGTKVSRASLHNYSLVERLLKDSCIKLIKKSLSDTKHEKISINDLISHIASINKIKYLLQVIPVKDLLQVRLVKDLRQVEPVKYLRQVRLVKDLLQIMPVKDLLQIMPVKDFLKYRPVKDLLQGGPAKDLLQVRPVKGLLQGGPVKYLLQVRPVKYLLQVRPVKDLLQGGPVKDLPQVKSVKDLIKEKENEKVVGLENIGDYLKVMNPFLAKCDSIFIEKAGEIIPQVISVDLAAKSMRKEFFYASSKCPSCGNELKVKTQDTDIKIYCVNRQCKAIFQARMDYFCSKNGFDIDFLGPKQLELFIKLGFIKSLPDVFQLKNHREELLKLNRFGVKSVNNLLNAIENSKKCEFSKFLCSLGIEMLGKVTADTLAHNFLDWDSLTKANYDDLRCLDGFGELLAKRVFDWMNNPENIALVEELLKNGVILINSTSSTMKMATKGTVVVTGTLTMSRQIWHDKLRRVGYLPTSKVSAKTIFLLVGDKPGGKLAEAKRLNVEIINEQMANEKFFSSS